MLRRGWHRAVRSTEVDTGAIVPAIVGRQPVLVARLQNGDAVAFATRCPHQDTDLGDAAVWDDKVRCPRHHYLYDPCTGENIFPAKSKDHTKLWKTKPRYLPVYPVEERDDGWIWVAASPLPPPPSYDPSLEVRPVGAEDEPEEEPEDEEVAVTEVVKTLRVVVGSTFELRLPTNPLPGHIWDVQVGGRLEVMEQGLLPGDPPRWRVLVAAREEGEDEVRCDFRQPWDVQASEKRRYVVKVESATGG